MSDDYEGLTPEEEEELSKEEQDILKNRINRMPGELGSFPEEIMKAHEWARGFVLEHFDKNVEGYLRLVRDNPRDVELHVNQLVWLVEHAFFSGTRSFMDAHVDTLGLMQIAFMLGYVEKEAELQEAEQEKSLPPGLFDI